MGDLAELGIDDLSYSTVMHGWVITFHCLRKLGMDDVSHSIVYVS